MRLIPLNKEEDDDAQGPETPEQLAIGVRETVMGQNDPDDEKTFKASSKSLRFPAFPITAYFRWLSENETKHICPIAIRSQRVEYEVLCTKAIAARRSTTSNGLTAN